MLGYKELGDHLQNFSSGRRRHRRMVQRQLVKALAGQGYVAATTQPPSLVLVFRWGYIAPEIVHRRFVNRDEMMTYVIGDNWGDLAAAAQHKQLDPGTQSLDFGNERRDRCFPHRHSSRLYRPPVQGADHQFGSARL